MAPPRRRPKARVESLIHAAYDDGEINTRAACVTAYRVHVLRLAAGHDEHPSDEAAAGSILEALSQHDARILGENVASLIRSLGNG